MERNVLTIASIFMAVGILLGALGAHGLKPHLTPEELESYKTGVFYHLIHALAIGLIAVLAQHNQELRLMRVMWCFLIGIICFSGSIYLLSTDRWLGFDAGSIGFITPLGGIFFVVGWLLLAWENYRVDAG